MAEKRVIEATTATTNKTVELGTTATALFLNNKSGADLTFTVKNQRYVIVSNFVMKDGQSIEWSLAPFDRIEIVASGFYQIVAGKEAR